jgi:hypothetical protein
MPQRNSTNTMLGITAHFRRQDGKSVDPPPSKFDRSGYVYDGETGTVRLDGCRGVLGGDVAQLFYAFAWCFAFQGDTYWYNRRCGNVELSPEDRDYIEWLLEEYS